MTTQTLDEITDASEKVINAKLPELWKTVGYPHRIIELIGEQANGNALPGFDLCWHIGNKFNWNIIDEGEYYRHAVQASIDNKDTKNSLVFRLIGSDYNWYSTSGPKKSIEQKTGLLETAITTGLLRWRFIMRSKFCSTAGEFTTLGTELDRIWLEDEFSEPENQIAGQYIDVKSKSDELHHLHVWTKIAQQLDTI